MEGRLFRYGRGAANVAFMSGRHPRHVIMIGGLTDGLLFAPYCRPLAARLEDERWSLVQTLLSSSHAGYGTASLDQDADELHQLATCLKEEHGSQGVVILGHSTGCQDAVRYCQRHRASADAAPLLGAVLQAPVSDVEWFATNPPTAERLALARAMVEQGKGEEIAFRIKEYDGAAITARRWLALAEPGGDDDMFSSALSDAQLGSIFGAMVGLPTLVLLSGAEECVASQDEYRAQGQRIVQAIGAGARLRIVKGAAHALNGKEEEGSAAITACVATLGPPLVSRDDEQRNDGGGGGPPGGRCGCVVS
ncbi:UPF0613 -like [Micractinium conductrix]|uniref:UPF0613 -like n=1 Tax=Micractinium conductrix TaxID=554055 RepID=A0A2P6VFM7_9CHLO|nr:UPF0613 -like [Micractinium conductrix]|eukprot:PSC72892.1 UPF0613 -like [Micractinium conductrix]